MNSIEKNILNELGVPTDPVPDKVLILGVTAHLDWDWQFTFPEYYDKYHSIEYMKYPVRQIFSNAIQYVEASRDKTPPYYYSISVVDYLKKFADDRPDWFERFVASGDRFRIVGGGVTSPDNLIPNGETLIRNYLLTDVWLRQRIPAELGKGLAPLPQARQAWVPDDFGHSANFPILLQALGFEAVGFSRLPPRAGKKLTHDKEVDFIWKATDGSQVLAHWMQHAYYQGQKIHPTSAIEKLKVFIVENDPAAPTPYVYVPVSIDFGQPIESIREVASYWNKKYAGTRVSVWVVGATFDHYARLVACHREDLKPLTYPDFQPTPYWTGFYGSRPELKSLHQEATRALVGAEVFGLIDGCLGGSGISADVATGWWTLTPSTHHDYVTGTSYNEVYKSEQIPLLRAALQAGSTARDAAATGIASAREPAEAGASVASLPILVLNQLGFDRGGLVDLKAIGTFAPKRFSIDGTPRGPVQVTADGRWLLCLPDDCQVPSMGYISAFLEDTEWAEVSDFKGVSLDVFDGGKSATLENSTLLATISQEEKVDWCLQDLKEKVGDAFVSTFDGGRHRTLIYEDTGDLYHFGNEPGSGTFNVQDTTFTPGELKVLSRGPVLVELEVSGQYRWNNGNNFEIKRNYTLVAGEPFIRVKTTAAAPTHTSILDAIPWGPINSFWHGEPAHWITKPAVPATDDPEWTAPIFQATHDFVIARKENGDTLGAVYQSALPAWAVLPNHQLVGCLLRNVIVRAGNDWDAGDPWKHEVTYALRVPNGLSAPESGQPLRESLSLTTPLQAKIVSGTPPSTFSLASVSVDGAPPGKCPAILTAAKPSVDDPGNMVLRIYRSTNGPQSLTVSVKGFSDAFNGALAAYPISALERPDTKGEPFPINEDGVFKMQAEWALSTVLIGPASSELPV